MAKADRFPVSLRAVIQRINRKLAPDLRKLKKTRERYRSDLGDYYVLDFDRNFILWKHVEPETLAKELGVLGDFERVEEDASKA